MILVHRKALILTPYTSFWMHNNHCEQRHSQIPTVILYVKLFFFEAGFKDI